MRLLVPFTAPFFFVPNEKSGSWGPATKRAEGTLEQRCGFETVEPGSAAEVAVGCGAVPVVAATSLQNIDELEA